MRASMSLRRTNRHRKKKFVKKWEQNIFLRESGAVVMQGTQTVLSYWGPEEISFCEQARNNKRFRLQYIFLSNEIQGFSSGRRDNATPFRVGGYALVLFMKTHFLYLNTSTHAQQYQLIHTYTQKKKKTAVTWEDAYNVTLLEPRFRSFCIYFWLMNKWLTLDRANVQCVGHSSPTAINAHSVKPGIQVSFFSNHLDLETSALFINFSMLLRGH